MKCRRKGAKMPKKVLDSFWNVLDYSGQRCSVLEDMLPDWPRRCWVALESAGQCWEAA